MDIVSSFSHHNGAKAEATSRAVVFDAMSFASAWARENVGNDVRKVSARSRHCNALSLSPSHCLMPIAPRLGSRWREHDANLPPSLRRRQSKSALLSCSAVRLHRRADRGRVMLQCTKDEAIARGIQQHSLN
jgi:hypothetical protein